MFDSIEDKAGRGIRKEEEEDESEMRVEVERISRLKTRPGGETLYKVFDLFNQGKPNRGASLLYVHKVILFIRTNARWPLIG